MSKKRFERWNDHSCKVKDNQEDTFLNWEDVVKKLNEQQTTINKQLDQIIELQDKYRILEFNHSRLEKRNKAQYEKIDEQQATIQSFKEENEELKRKLEYCEHEHFLDSLGSSNKWFGMGGF